MRDGDGLGLLALAIYLAAAAAALWPVTKPPASDMTQRESRQSDDDHATRPNKIQRLTRGQKRRSDA